MRSVAIIWYALLLGYQSAQAQNVIGANIFEGCSRNIEDTSYKTVNHDLFSIEIPSDWQADQEPEQGINISSTAFPDAKKRGFVLSVVPHKDFCFKKNSLVDYYRFQKGTYNGYRAILLMRDDLMKLASKNTVYWRTELKILNKKEDWLYILVMGKRATATKEPNWCEFQKMIQSLEIKE